MKKVALFTLFSSLIFAKVHYAKVEPYQRVTISSSVSGLVTDANLSYEGRYIANRRVIHIDDKIDIINLKDTQESIRIFENMVTINMDIAKSLEQSLARQKSYYERLSKLSTTSKSQKDNAFVAYSGAKSQYLSIKEKILSLKKQILDLRLQEARLADSIEKKSITLNDKYLYRLLIREGEFVTPAKPLAIVDDVSKAKLVLYLDSDELVDIESKSIYLDDKKSDYKIAKIWSVSDDKFISSYKVEIDIDKPKDRFSKLIKVEFK